MPIRLRLPELLESRGMSAYAFAKATSPALSRSLAYRLVATRGDFRCLKPGQIEAMCSALDVKPGSLFVRTVKRAR